MALHMVRSVNALAILTMTIKSCFKPFTCLTENLLFHLVVLSDILALEDCLKFSIAISELLILLISLDYLDVLVYRNILLLLKFILRILCGNCLLIWRFLGYGTRLSLSDWINDQVLFKIRQLTKVVGGLLKCLSLPELRLVLYDWSYWLIIRCLLHNLGKHILILSRRGPLCTFLFTKQ